ncbi:unnamed protein product [Peniophora sp. CBMAI 1063]|nr:unnamed protein product [Peniophora sp. CBMAI 1063]
MSAPPVDLYVQCAPSVLVQSFKNGTHEVKLRNSDYALIILNWIGINIQLLDLAAKQDDLSLPVSKLVLHGVCYDACSQWGPPRPESSTYLQKVIHLPYAVDLIIDECLAAYVYVVPWLEPHMERLRYMDLTICEHDCCAVPNPNECLTQFGVWYEILLDATIKRKKAYGNTKITHVSMEYAHSEVGQLCCHGTLVIGWSDGITWTLRYSGETAAGVLRFIRDGVFLYFRTKASRYDGGVSIQWKLRWVPEREKEPMTETCKNQVEWERELKKRFLQPPRASPGPPTTLGP